VTSSTRLSGTFSIVRRTLDIGHANLPRLHVFSAPGSWSTTYRQRLKRQLTLRNLVVNVISQTRSEYGGQDIEGVSVGI
jgi:hypothetical protein